MRGALLGCFELGFNGLHTGRDVANFDYYLVLAMFKSGCIMEYKVAQAAAGHLTKQTGDFFSGFVLANFADAARMIQRL